MIIGPFFRRFMQICRPSRIGWPDWTARSTACRTMRGARTARRRSPSLSPFTRWIRHAADPPGRAASRLRRVAVGCHAGTGHRLGRLQRRDPTLRSATAQRARYQRPWPTCNSPDADLAPALDLLVKADERRAERPSVKTVALAVRLARHSAHGWTIWPRRLSNRRSPQSLARRHGGSTASASPPGTTLLHPPPSSGGQPAGDKIAALLEWQRGPNLTKGVGRGDGDSGISSARP